MRVISGRYKGHSIVFPKGIRPTQNKVRKALFDILRDIRGLSFLELFAGSGAVSLEAASQGAAKIVMVENNQDCLRALKSNFSRLSYAEYRLLAIDAFKAIVYLAKEKSRFDIIFLDPPYRKGRDRAGLDKRPVSHSASKGYGFDSLPCRFSNGTALDDNHSLAKKTLKMLSAYDILAPNGFIVIQHFKKDDLSAAVDSLIMFKQSGYGGTSLSFYKKI